MISNSQFGFRPGLSTLSALLSVTHKWFSLLDYHNSVCAVFFDLRKAFDSVLHQPLLDTLSSTGIPPHLILWLCNYLRNRFQQVVLNGSSSHKSHVLSQGSILGPLLFIIFINGLCSVTLSPTARLSMYADDILELFQTYNSVSDISLIQSNIDSVSSWISSRSLTINSSKTKYMFLSLRSSRSASLPSLCLNGSPLERVYSYKYLGVIISSNLSWSLHIHSICCKSRKLIGLLFRHFYPHSSPSVLFRLYNSLVRPHLEYCSYLWDPSSSASISYLEKVRSSP